MIGRNHRTNLLFIILDLILPVNLTLLIPVLFIQIWYMQIPMDIEGLQTKRFLVNPLLEVLQDRPDSEKQIPEWITFVGMDDGTVLYPLFNIHKTNQTWMEQKEGINLNRFVASLVTDMPNNMNMINFTYQGQKGLCFYRKPLLPGVLRILHSPTYLIYLFFIAMLLFTTGLIIINSFKKNEAKLILAAQRIRNMDFDTQLKPNRINHLADVFTAFDNMRCELEHFRSQGIRFIMSISHDLKTPLTSIRAYIEAMKDGVIVTPEERSQAIGKILLKTNLLEARIDELLDLSMIFTSGKKMSYDVFSIKKWTGEMIEYFREDCLINGRSFSVEENLTENLKIRGSMKVLTRAVMNLFDNACRYTQKEDPIRMVLSVSEDKEHFVLIFEDGGTGVSPEDRDLVFELFYRKDKGRNTRGMGIGLTSVKYVVEEHGGSVFCEKSSLGGACFRINLPLLPL